MHHKLGDILFVIAVVAGILVATRPGSQGPKMVGAVGGAFADAIRAATGSGSKTSARKQPGKKPRVNR